jgi:PAS domain S-box-containing protein
MSTCPLCVEHATGGFWSNLFATDFVPRAECVGDRPEIIWLHVASDAAIALSYYSIPLALGYFVYKRKDLAFGWMFKLFAAFILACGTTHLMAVVAYWHPMYRLDGVIKAGTGVLSILTAMTLWPLIPKALSLPLPSELRNLNRKLEEEIVVRRQAQAELEQARAGLEAAVAARTSELASVNTALSASVAELESIYSSAPLGLCLVDNEGRVLRRNERMVSIVGPSIGEIGRRLADAAPAIDRLVQAMVKPVPGETVDPVLRIPAPQNHGAQTVLLVAAQPVRGPDGQPTGACIAVKDVTDRARLTEQVHQSQKMEAVGQLASGIAHDINNTLTAIYGYLSLALVALEKNHAATPYLEKIAIAAEQASQTTRTLLTFAKPAPPRREPVELAPTIQQAMSMARGLMPATIDVNLDINEDGCLWVQADPTQLQQIFLNLAINARDAMGKDGKLTVSLRRSGDSARISFADNGVGMSAEVQARIFEPFFTTKSRGEGTGLGLAVVQGIVRSHNGAISVASAPNQGTTFTLDLPAIVPPGTQAVAKGPGTPQRGAGTILLVEDNSHVRELLTSGLQAAGFHVIAVGSGDAFLEQAQKLNLSATAYILDIDIPGRLGTECLADRRARGDRTPAIFISGGRSLDVTTDSLTKVLAKPFHSSDLIRAINAVILSSRLSTGQ